MFRERLLEVLKSRRTVRCYRKKAPPLKDLKKIIDAARFSPVRHNLNIYEFLLILDNKQVSFIQKEISNIKLFPCLASKYRQCRPPVFVVILANLIKMRTYEVLIKKRMDLKKPPSDIMMQKRQFDMDALSFSLTIMYASEALGVSSWFLGSGYNLNLGKLEARLKQGKIIPFYTKVASVIGLGYAKEKIRTADMQDEDGVLLYFRNKTLVVPKPRLEDVLFVNKYK